MSEALYQKKLIDRLKKKGWTVIKNISVNKTGWPDLTAYKPHLPPLFIEVKDTGGRLSDLQKFRIDSLKKKGFKVLVAWKPTKKGGNR